MLDAVAGKFTVQDLSLDFEHQVVISMCMVVVSLILRSLTSSVAMPVASTCTNCLRPTEGVQSDPRHEDNFGRRRRPGA
jgi:hypothetical protein